MGMDELNTATEASLDESGTYGVAPPITAPFHSKVSIFTAPYLDNYWVRNEKTSDLDMGRRPELKSEVFFSCENPIVIEIISLLCEIAPR